MEDKSKIEKEQPEVSAEEIEEEKVEEPQDEPEVKTEDEQVAETPETAEEEESTSDDISKESAEESSEETETGETLEKKEEPVEAKKKKEPAKKEVKKKKADHGPDFKYIVRISNTDIDGEKKIVHGLTKIKGVGLHLGTIVADKSGIDRNMKMGDLKDAQVEKIQKTLDDISNNLPSWMLNHRKDYDTGGDIHLVGSDIDMRLREEINILKKIRSYRGIRHERGLPVRGQRTRANNRTGLTLGVSKKRVTATASSDNKKE